MEDTIEMDIKRDVDIQLSTNHHLNYFTIKQEFEETTNEPDNVARQTSQSGDIIQCVLNEDSIKHYYDEYNNYLKSEVDACIVRNTNNQFNLKNDQKSFACTITVKELSFIKAYKFINSGKKFYACSLCNYYKTNHFDSLKRHKKNNCMQNLLKSCKKCKTKEPTLQDLKDRKERQMKRENRKNKKAAVTLKSDININDNYMCLMCTYRCDNLADLREHTLFHTKCSYLNGEDCSCVQNPNEDKKYTGRSALSCVKCKFTCMDSDEFKQHELEHNQYAVANPCEDEKTNNYFTDLFSFDNDYNSDGNNSIYEPVKRKKEYSCDLCPFRCERKSVLSKHIRKHRADIIPKSEHQYISQTSEGDRYHCNICDKSFKGQPILKRHQRLSHSDLKQFACDMCDFKTKHIWIFQKHMYTYHDRAEFKNLKLYSCEICNYKARYPYILKKHRLLHGQSDNQFLCKNCGNIYSDKSELIKHSEESHPEDTDFLLEAVKFEANFKDHDTTDDPEASRFRCNFCSYKTSRRYLMKNHTLKLHYKDECVRRHSDKRLTCNLCNYTAIVPSIMKRHQQRHSEDRPFICEKCGARFKFQDILQKHMQSHVLEKPYVCDVCGRAFRSTTHLKMHSTIHSDQTPYSCNKCDQRCKSRYFLRVHKLKKHDPAGWVVYQQNRKKRRPRRRRYNDNLKLFPCDKCAYSTKNIADLKTHKRTHSDEKPFCCDVCTYRSRFSSNLIKHKQSHLMEKPFTCNVCSKNLKTQTYLEHHMMLHTGVRPFICESCPKGFIRRDRLVRHIREVHKPKVL